MAVTPVSSSTKPLPGSFEEKQLKLAEDTIKKILKSEDVVQSLASLTSFWLPPDEKGLTSTLWGFFNIDSNRALKREDVERTVTGLGLSSAAARAVWDQINPVSTDKKNPVRTTELTGNNFIINSFVMRTISENIKTVQEDVKTAQLLKGDGGTNTVLGDFDKLGGNSIFDVLL